MLGPLSKNQAQCSTFSIKSEPETVLKTFMQYSIPKASSLKSSCKQIFIATTKVFYLAETATETQALKLMILRWSLTWRVQGSEMHQFVTGFSTSQSMPK